MTDAIRDQNFVPVALGVSSTDAAVTLPFSIDPITGRLLTDTAGGGSGTVTSVSVVSANGFAGSVATATTTPAITISTTITGILQGDGTAISAAATTGSGSVVLATSPTLVTPVIGVATGTSLSVSGLLASATGLTLEETGAGTDIITIQAPASIAAPYTLTLPIDDGANGEVLSTNGSGVLSWISAGGVPTAITVANEAADSTCFVGFFTAATGDLGPKTNANLTFNSTNGALTATTFIGNLTGNVTGTVSGNAGTVTTANEATDTTCFITFATAASGSLPVSTNANMTFNSNTGVATFASTVLTTTDINGGTIDGTTIGASSATTIVGTTITANTSFLPDADGGAAIGSATLGFTILGLSSGSTINFANGNVLLTHSSGILTVTTGDLRVTTAGTNSASVVTVGGTQTLTAKTLTSPAITTATFTGAQVLAENASIQLDPAGSADGKFTGITVTGTAGYTQAFGDVVYLDPTDSRWEACDANSAQGADGDSRGIVGMVVVAGTDGNACTILLQGIIRADAKFPALTINNPVYISETAGSITQTQPVTTDVVIRVVGFGITADEMYFNPSPDYITHT